MGRAATTPTTAGSSNARTGPPGSGVTPASLATGRAYASSMFFEPPVWTPYTQNITAEQTGWTQQLNIWLTPWGFLKGAEMYDATEAQQRVDGDMLTAVTWMTPDGSRNSRVIIGRVYSPRRNVHG